MKKLVIKKSNIIYWLFLFFCFFPFINILRLPTDSQPNALFLALIIIFLNFKTVIYHFPGKLKIFAFLILISLIPIYFSKLSIDTIISLLSYISLIIIPLAVLISLIKLDGLSYKFYLIVVYIWMFVAIIQKFLYPNFLNFLLTRSIGSGFMGRGVNSLAPEPTYYGSIVLLLFILFLINFKFKKFIIILLFIQLFILSISSTVFAVLLFSFIIFVLFNIIILDIKIKQIFISIVTILIFYITFLLIKDQISETRIYILFNILIDKPELLFLDESINERVNHAIFPLISIFDNYGLPMGYGKFQEYILLKSSEPSYYVFFERINIEQYRKVMSGYGAVFFELGIFGVIIPIYIFSVFKPYLNNSLFLFSFIILNLLLFTSISLNNPLILFVFGNLLYNRYKFKFV